MTDFTFPGSGIVNQPQYMGQAQNLTGPLIPPGGLGQNWQNALGAFNTLGSGLGGTGINANYGLTPNTLAPNTSTATPASNSASANNTTAQSMAFESNIFIRAIVVISGFIFLGIGLWMLKPNGIKL